MTIIILSIAAWFALSLVIGAGLGSFIRRADERKFAAWKQQLDRETTHES